AAAGFGRGCMLEVDQVCDESAAGDAVHICAIEDCADVVEENNAQVFIRVLAGHCDSGFSRPMTPLAAAGVGNGDQRSPVVSRSVFQCWGHFGVEIEPGIPCPFAEMAT